MRINDSRSHKERGVDAYFTPPEATEALMRIEELPHSIVDPACGDGAILRVLRPQGHVVRGYDIIDYGWPGTKIEDYTRSPLRKYAGIITNPPFIHAQAFLEKALMESSYVAFLLRLNFLESTRRKPFFEKHPPTRVWISSRRLPMMHRHGWTGTNATSSNQTFAWFIYDRRTRARGNQLRWFDWRDLQ